MQNAFYSGKDELFHLGWYTLFYKNNFIRTTRLKFAQKIKNKLRTDEVQLQMQM